jgi:hypothetical protein
MPSSARLDPARMDYTDGHALSAQESDPAGLRFWLVAGALGTLAVRKFRGVLASLAARARIWVTAGLAGLDDGHRLTAVAVLPAAAGKRQDTGSALTAGDPPRSLAPVLDAIPIALTCEQLAPSGAAGIQVGALAAGPRPAARRGPVPAVPDSRRA